MEETYQRLDLTRYNREAPLDESVPVKGRCNILLSQPHIGHLLLQLKAGDMVTKGQMIC